MKKKLIIIGAILIMLMAVGFPLAFGLGEMEDTNSADREMTRATAQAMQEMNAQIGMPAIKNYQERKLMKMIFELRDKADLVCYAYNFSEVTGKYTFIGKCIGYGLPYSVQYTNPERMETGGNSNGYWGATIPQADPNGLFMPDGLSATWVMLVNEETGDVQPVYMEPTLTVSQFPLPARICMDGVNK